MTQTAQSRRGRAPASGRLHERRADWDAFSDARVEGFKRAQHRFIGSGAFRQKTDASVIPAQIHALVMFIPPGQGNAPLHMMGGGGGMGRGLLHLTGQVLVHRGRGRPPTPETVDGAGDCVSGPANVIHGLTTRGLEPAYLQVRRAGPAELMT